MEEKKQQIYNLVLEQLNETFNPEHFDDDLTNQVFDKRGLPEFPDFTYKRYLYKGNRLYVKLPLTWKDGYPEIGNTILSWGYSLTTVINWSEPMRGFNPLENWKTNMRLKGINPDEYAKERADFGTSMHYLFSLFLKGQVFDKKSFKEDCLKLMMKDNLFSKSRAIYILDNYERNLWNSLIGFGRFVTDYNVKPIATELIVQDLENWVATPIDLLCTLEEPIKIKVEVPTGEFYVKGEKKGEAKTKLKTYIVPKEKVAIVDFKSGSKGFYDAHYYQLNWGKNMLKETYGVDVEVLFNYAPEDDMSTNYKVKKQIGNERLDKWLPLMKQVSNMHLQEVFEGGIKLSYDDSGDTGKLDIKNFKRQEDEKDYEIIGEEIQDNEVNFKFNFKEYLNGSKE